MRLEELLDECVFDVIDQMENCEDIDYPAPQSPAEQELKEKLRRALELVIRGYVPK
jgi:hypothetical protein